MTRGACFDLPPAVVDKYLGAARNRRGFEYHTGLAICAGCAIRAACLTDAISSPAVYPDSEAMIRGGENGVAIREMRRKHFLDGVPVADLVTAALRQQAGMKQTGDFRYLREGRFADAKLLGPAS